MTTRAWFDGIAKPMPMLPPEGEKIAVLMPITSPSMSNIGPPELPRLIDGVGLDEIVIGAGIDVALAGRDDAGRHRAAEPERVADRDHPIADPHRVRIAPIDGRSAAPLPRP